MLCEKLSRAGSLTFWGLCVIIKTKERAFRLNDSSRIVTREVTATVGNVKRLLPLFIDSFGDEPDKSGHAKKY